MRLANIDGRPAVLIGDGYVALDQLDHGQTDGSCDPFIDVIRRWDEVVGLVAGTEPKPLDGVVLGPPIPRPSKIVGIPVNYVDHQREMNAAHTVAGLGFFLKSPSSVVGPSGQVTLPFPGRRTDQEAELGVVIGSRTAHVSAARALDHVFGYTCLVDVTVRGNEERSTRKSFDGFTPIGPWVTPGYDLPEPTDLTLRGWVNGELRQEASTSQMVYGVAQLIEFVSSVVTLEPGDVIATGTPAGVGPIASGDVIRVEVEGVGSLQIPVVASDREPHPLWLTREA